MKKYELDGKKVESLESFFVAFGEMVNGPGGYFGKNLTAFNDCLYGGYGLENPCEIHWLHSDYSRIFLDRNCRLNYLKGEMEKWDDDEILADLRASIRTALEPGSPAMMDILVDTIKGANNGKIIINLVLA